MSLIGTYSLGSASANRYSSVDDLLYELPDNNSNLIIPHDIRDSVYTLWSNINDVSIIAASAASASAFFQNSNPMLINVGGLTAGTTFTSPTNMQTMWNNLLYPYVAPNASISFGGLSNVVYQYGLKSPHLSYFEVLLNWSATENSNVITSINVAGQSQPPSHTSGSFLIISTHSLTPPAITNDYYTINVSDGTQTTISTASVTWMNKIYWGSIDLSSIGNPDLNMNPGSASNVSSYISNSMIINLPYSYGGGSMLSSVKSNSYNSINGNGNYLIFAWPSNMVGATAPSFTVNGMINTSFTSIETNWSFTNENSFASPYEVWISNTAQNAPLNIVIN